MDTFKHRWHQLPISRQLLVLVNAILFGFVVSFLVVDYRLRMDRHLNEKQIALTEEAKTMYESLLVAEAHGGEAIQDLVDNVCARMNTDDSPGHHIAADWRGLPYQAISHGHASDEMLSAMRSATDSIGTEATATGSLVVGSFTGPAGTVYISEKRSAVAGATRRSLLIQMLAVLLLGAIAAFVVSAVLRQLIAKPIQGFVSALQSVASGDLSVMARTRSCRELSYLADQINAMTEALDHAQRDHRVHMEKARQIQQNLRPAVNGLVGIDVAELFEPADDVGGDYYDVIPLSDGRYLLCVADVSGHGVPAAMAATLLKAFVSEAAKKSSSPAVILTDVNQRYCEYVMMGHFATMAILVVDPKRRQLTYANAGHEFPFLQIGRDTPVRLNVGDLILGVEDDTHYDEETIPLGDSARLVIVSDGVTEAFDPSDEQYGTERIEHLLDSVQSCNARELVESFESSIEAFRKGRKAFDDTTLLVAQLT
ncbi:sigma-B regulation protein RsbU (phosphoserine phosphatase) [Rhodopirellula rubra]|uniref:Sigma-B regulation protein RsbU (Phosphoserine phosphatase) n=1 Tax=Aporhodopirellula rubra TaxID=980271 RepID=A0A7W5H4P3_9BACT|nr:SpoIIE family protein phosphatase [Aporhodopirellula rubra]MBB3205041.1 sigma-B regulation protein RsbU (phosphoserine phosphatase) [Aporhodopirellula rubra]